MPANAEDMATVGTAKHGSIRALEWTNFFLADVQAGLGPFVAAYLASIGGNQQAKNTQ